MKKKYLFIDRDGTIVEEPHDFQVDKVEKVTLKANVIASLLKLKDFGYSFIMISNQDGLGTESFPANDFEKTQNFILKLFRSQGIEFDDVLICPHFESDRCECRKPRAGLMIPYLKDTSWDRGRSYVIGDRQTDIELAQKIGLKSFNVELTPWDEITISIIKEARIASISRKTKETDIEVLVNLNSQKEADISTGIYFFDHMLDQIAKHANFYIKLKVKADLEVDDHHCIEDVGIALGTAINEALGDKRSIDRYGFYVPMDEALASCILDLSGRSYLNFSAQFKAEKIGDMSTQMIEHFFDSFTKAMQANIHLKVQGENDHHKAEALFKALARSLALAIKQNDSNSLPSTKGII